MSIGAIISLIIAVKDLIVFAVKVFGMIRDWQRQTDLLKEEKAKADKLKNAETSEEIKDAARDVLSGF